MIINKGLIEPIFAIPMYRNILSTSLTKEQIAFIEKNKKDVFKNEGNTFTKDTDILEHKVFKNLKKELNEMLKEYYEIVLHCTSNIKPYITQSWLNYTEDKQYHHKHEHPNSIISAVVYLNAGQDSDEISFYKKRDSSFEFDASEFTIYNSGSMGVPVQTGHVVMFPSEVTHMVRTKSRDHTRISLAFNTFFRGNAALEPHSLKRLIIK